MQGVHRACWTERIAPGDGGQQTVADTGPRSPAGNWIGSSLTQGGVMAAHTVPPTTYTSSGVHLQSTPRRRMRTVGVVSSLAGLVVSASIVAAVSLTGHADTAPANPADPTTPVTVSADALPTVQIDGVAWSQAVVGNTVYVGGRFTNARPAGAAAGVNQTARSNFLAYNLTTGELITTFAPSFNAQVRSVVASPDGTRLYVGGDFTSVNGVSRSRIAAFDLDNGQELWSHDVVEERFHGLMPP